MAETKTITTKELQEQKIPPSFITKNGVQSLADRPNQMSPFSGRGGMSPAELKAAFDALSTKLVETVNKIIDYSTSGNVYVPWGERAANLTELVAALENSMLNVIQVPKDISTTNADVDLYSELENHKSLFSNTAEGVDTTNKKIQELQMDTRDRIEVLRSVPPGSEGLSVASSYVSNTYYVRGRGTCEDVDIVIPATAYQREIHQIVSSAFENDQTIRSVVIGRNVNLIGNKAFAGCKNLKWVRFVSEHPPTLIYADSFDDTIEKIIVSSNAVERYKEDTDFSKWVDKIVSEDTIKILREEIDNLWEFACGSAGDVTREGIKEAVVVNGEVRYPSEGLIYELNGDGESYTVVGLGTCTDINVVVPRTYNGKPVTAIGDNAFEGANIDSINLWECVTSIGKEAFKGCAPFRFVYIYSTTPIAVGEGAFPETVQGYFVPLHNVEDYKADEDWTDYAGKIVAIETFESVNTHIVNVVNLLQQVDATLAQMDANLAAVDQNLVSVDANLQKQIDDLKGYSQGLEYVVVNVNNTLGFCVKGKGTCTDKDIVIPPTYNGFPVLSIKTGAFKHDTSGITSVVIPETVVSIGKGAFDFMTGLVNGFPSITCLAKTPPKAVVEYLYLFYMVNDVYVPSESIEAYKLADGWSSRASSLKPIETLETLRADIDAKQAQIDAINETLTSFVDVSKEGA